MRVLFEPLNSALDFFMKHFLPTKSFLDGPFTLLLNQIVLCEFLSIFASIDAFPLIPELWFHYLFVYLAILPSIYIYYELLFS